MEKKCVKVSCERKFPTAVIIAVLLAAAGIAMFILGMKCRKSPSCEYSPWVRGDEDER